MIALTELFIHDAHEPSMTAASDILWKPACLSRQDVLLERERRRTDRTPAPAHAQRQHAGIHRHFPHDFSIDTSADTPRKCAMRLISLLPGEFLP